MSPFGLFGDKESNEVATPQEQFIGFLTKVISAQAVHFSEQLNELAEINEDAFVESDSEADDLSLSMFLLTTSLWKSLTYLFIWNAVCDGTFGRVDRFMHQIGEESFYVDYLKLASLTTLIIFDEEYDVDGLEELSESTAQEFVRPVLDKKSYSNPDDRCGMTEIDAVFAGYQRELSLAAGVKFEALNPYMRELASEHMAGSENNFGKLRNFIEVWADRNKV
jgi:hypothetical protein